MPSAVHLESSSGSATGVPKGDPRVSVILAVKDGMPFLPDAIQSLRAQTYWDFELVVQDAVSTDGTIEYLRSITDLRIDLVSEPDAGHGDAYNRALTRCRGEIITTLDADNLFEPTSLADAVALIDANPGYGAIYGAAWTIGPDGSPISEHVPADWDLLEFMRCELVPPFSTAYFVRDVCGPALRFDETIAWCQDYDLWLRLSTVPILRTTTVLGRIRVGEHSLSGRSENYDRFCEEKIYALDRFLERTGTEQFGKRIRDQSVGGIYSWAANAVRGLDAPPDAVKRYVRLAEAHDKRIRRKRRLDAIRNRLRFLGIRSRLRIRTRGKAAGRGIWRLLRHQRPPSD